MKILVTEPEFFDEESLNILKKVGEVEARRMNKQEILEKISDANVLIVRVETKVDKEIIDAGKKLKIIATPTTGIDHIDTEEAERRGIEIISAPGSNADATAELTFALLLSLLRKIPFAFNTTSNGVWDRNNFFGNELKGKTIGIIGCGRIGSRVGKYSKAFGMNVVVYDPLVEPKILNEIGATSVSFEKLISESDIITLHTFLSEETKNMIDKEEFEKMKNCVLIVNTARGKLINEEALIQALNSKKIGGAALDVFADEPLTSENPLTIYARTHNNLILTPHLAGSTQEAVKNAAVFVAEQIYTKLLNIKA